MTITNLIPEALADALEIMRQWRSPQPESRPIYDITIDRDGVGRDADAPPVAIATDGVIAANQLLLDGGELTSRDLVDQSLDAIARRNDELHAFVEIMEVEAREQAAKLDAELSAGRRRGPLHGIPVSVKDLYAVRGGTTHAGSIAFERRDATDAEAVRRLRESGAAIIGKTATHEFAMGVTAPQSRNPHDPKRIAGGSSSGAAIAVATGMGMAALGTDTRGSIRLPAALSGVVGLKPTYGTASLDGVLPLSWTMDHMGVIAPSITDATVTFAAVSDRDITASRAAQTGLRVGVPRAAWSEAAVAVEDSVESALTMLAATGVSVVEVERPNAADFDHANLISLIVSRCEAFALHRDLGLDRKLYSADVREQLESAAEVDATAYIDAQRYRAQLQREMMTLFESVDALLMPTVSMLAPLRDDIGSVSLALTRNVALWSFVGFPAVSVPVAPAPSGLPVGLQIVAAPHHEAAMLAVGRAVERAVNAS